MTDYSEILKRLEEATSVISDESLRRIAFEQLLKHELSGQKRSSLGMPPKDEHEEIVVRSKRTKGRVSAITPPSAIRENVRNLQISPDEGGLPAWNTLGALDKYLWILEAASKKGVDGLSLGEISFLIFEIFKENHQTNQVNNLKTRIRKTHVRAVKIQIGSTTLGSYQILKGGIDHLKKLASDGGKK